MEIKRNVLILRLRGRYAKNKTHFKMGVCVFWERLFNIAFLIIGCKYSDPCSLMCLQISLKVLINQHVQSIIFTYDLDSHVLQIDEEFWEIYWVWNYKAA